MLHRVSLTETNKQTLSFASPSSCDQKGFHYEWFVSSTISAPQICHWKYSLEIFSQHKILIIKPSTLGAFAHSKWRWTDFSIFGLSNQVQSPIINKIAANTIFTTDGRTDKKMNVQTKNGQENEGSDREKINLDFFLGCSSRGRGISISNR